MVDGMSYLLRPIHHGMMAFDSIHKTDLDLNDFADANSYIDMIEENQARIHRWVDQNSKRR